MTRVLLCVALVGAFMVLSATSASACTCVAITDDEAFPASNVVFAGTVVEKREPEGRPVPGDPEVRAVSSADPATWVFAVERVYKGEVGDTQEVLSPAFGASCGLELGPPGTRALVFASRGDAPTYLFSEPVDRDAAHASLCGGSRRLARDEPAPLALAVGGQPWSGPLLAAMCMLGLIAVTVALRRSPSA